MLTEYSRTDKPLADLQKECYRAEMRAESKLEVPDLRLQLGLKSDHISRFRRRHASGYSKDDVLGYLEDAKPLIEEVSKRCEGYTPHLLEKLLR